MCSAHIHSAYIYICVYIYTYIYFYHLYMRSRPYRVPGPTAYPAPLSTHGANAYKWLIVFVKQRISYRYIYINVCIMYLI